MALLAVVAFIVLGDRVIGGSGAENAAASDGSLVSPTPTAGPAPSPGVDPEGTPVPGGDGGGGESPASGGGGQGGGGSQGSTPSDSGGAPGSQPQPGSGDPGETFDNRPVNVVRMTTLIDKGAGRVDWSRKHGLIAFSMLGDDGYFDVYTMKADGSNQMCLTCGKPQAPQLNNGQPSWHPSGDWIVFQAQDPDLDLPGWLKPNEDYLTQGGAGMNNNLWLVDRAGNRFFQLTHIDDAMATLHPHFSLDGKRLLWSAIDNWGNKRAWMLKVADFRFENGAPKLSNVKSYRPRGEANTFYESHGFHPDGKRIIFTASIGRASEFDLDIWMMDLTTEKLTQLTDSPGVWDEHGQISPSGKKVVWVSSEGYAFSPSADWRRTLNTDFWIMNIDGSNKQRLTEMGPVAADNAWNADGTKLVATLGVGSRASSVPSGRIVIIEFDRPL